jgi:hypothetical protein
MLCSFGYSTKDEELDLAPFHWILKFINVLTTQRYNTVLPNDARKCFFLSKLLTYKSISAQIRASELL